MESILGVQIGISSGCAVYYNGEIVYAASEERFTKIKNDTVFPEKSIKNAFDFLTSNNIPLPSKAVLPSINLDYRHYLMKREAVFSIKDYLEEQSRYWYPKIYQNKKVSFEDIFKSKFDYSLLDAAHISRLQNAKDSKVEWQTVRKELVEKCTGIKEIHFTNHEHSHAAYALYASPLSKNDTLAVAIDGYGDDGNCSVWIYENGKLKCLKTYSNFNIGRMYRYITLLMGMRPNEHEYKVMGLAFYPREELLSETYKVFENTYYFDQNDGEIKHHELPPDHYYYFKEKLEGHRFDIIAASLQKYTETMIVDMVRYWLKKTGKRKLVLAGGVSLNIKANMMLSELKEVDELYVPASGGDESQSIGAIFSYLDSDGKSTAITPLKNSYIGNEYSQSEMDMSIQKFCNNHKNFRYKEHTSNKEVASLLANGTVLARFVGRMEFGQRALGNRSIIANPGAKDIVKKINYQIKHRDFWMPFTPSMLDYRAEDYLVNPKSLKFPFMTVACRTTERAYKEISGSLHPADYTARPQIVTKESNFEYWDLLNEFNKLTGVGAFLNTSLNLSGLPICESPEDVFHVLLNSDIDMALLGTTLIHR